MHAGIGCVTPAALPEVGSNVIKLPPGNGHFVAICGINRNSALVRSVANDVLAILIDVHLITGEQAEWRNHSWRSIHFPRGSRRVIILLQWLRLRRAPPRGGAG